MSARKLFFFLTIPALVGVLSVFVADSAQAKSPVAKKETKKVKTTRIVLKVPGMK